MQIQLKLITLLLWLDMERTPRIIRKIAPNTGKSVTPGEHHGEKKDTLSYASLRIILTLQLVLAKFSLTFNTPYSIEDECETSKHNKLSLYLTINTLLI
jgi:hypothetical protein